MAPATVPQILRQQAALLLALAGAIESSALDVLDVRQAAEIARCTVRSVRSAITRGDLSARGTGRHCVIDRAELDRWLRDLPPRRVRERHDADGLGVDVAEEDIDARVAQITAEAAE